MTGVAKMMRPSGRASRFLADRRGQLIVLVAVLIIVMSLLSPYFLRASNLLSMTQYGAVIGLLAVGESLVILGGNGGIDLSVGAMLSLDGVVIGYLTQQLGWSPWLAAGIGLVAGAAMGAFNGLLVSVFRLPPLIITLATQFLFAALALVITGGAEFGGFKRDGFAALGQGAVLGVPTQVLLVMVPVFAIAIWFQSRTRSGLVLSEIGISQRAAALVGVNVVGVRFWLYLASGLTAALGAIVTNSWFLTANPTAGQGYELQAITIAVLGGIDIFGGRGRLTGVFLALLVVVILDSGLQLANVGNTVQTGILGAVLVLSVLVNVVIGPRRT